MPYRTKYADDLKKSIVNEVNEANGSRSISAIAASHSISDAVIHGWLQDQRYNPDYLSRQPKKKKSSLAPAKAKAKSNGDDVGHRDILFDLESNQATETPVRPPARLHDEQAFQLMTDRIRDLESEVSFLRKTTTYFANQSSGDI